MKELADFTPSELSEVAETLPSVAHYLALLQTPAPDVGAQLRSQRHKVWVEAAANTFLGLAPAEVICRQWSQKSEHLLKMAWQESGGSRRPLAVFAWGKLGAQELNLSSDVDLMFIAAERVEAEDLKALRQFLQLVTGVHSFGLFYRVDTDLRPGGRLGPLISTVNQLIEYYWEQGAPWERLAMVRLRPLFGMESVQAEVAEAAQKFAYRRYLEMTLLDDLRELRALNQSYRTPRDAHDLKLEPGGIRDIELFVHALQVIHGGRQPGLRTPHLNAAVEALQKNNTIASEDLEFLRIAYWRLREAENQLQIINDQQTYLWSEANPPRGFATDDLVALLKKSNTVVSELLGQHTKIPDLLPASPEEQDRWLASLSFNATSRSEVWPALLARTAQSTSGHRDEMARRRFLTLFIRELADRGWDRDLGLSRLLEFVRNTRAKASFFTLLLREPRLRHDLVALFSLSPYLSQVIASRPELLDSFIYRSQPNDAGSWEDLVIYLGERRLLADLTMGNAFLQEPDVLKLGGQLSAVADEIVQSLLDSLKTHFGEPHQRPNLEILCLGKWGGQELGCQSDLDFIFLTRTEPTAANTRLARRLVSALTQPQKGGALYRVDLRLRPSGSAGPMLISHNRLKKYLAEGAAIWERQSYLRARLLSGEPLELPLVKRPVTIQDLREAARIRDELCHEPEPRILDLKLTYGGLTDVELCVQTVFLSRHQMPESRRTTDMIEEMAASMPSHREFLPELKSNYLYLRTIEQQNQLTAQAPESRLHPESDSFSRLALLHKSSTVTLARKIASVMDQNRRLLNLLDPFSAPR